MKKASGNLAMVFPKKSPQFSNKGIYREQQSSISWSYMTLKEKVDQGWIKLTKMDNFSSTANRNIHAGVMTMYKYTYWFWDSEYSRKII